ncbi:hypothetical protein ACP70R_049804 [Stipagrostis hirtigluma subsp. patula]
MLLISLVTNKSWIGAVTELFNQVFWFKDTSTYTVQLYLGVPLLLQIWNC